MGGGQGYTQLDVGSGKPFATIQAAWDSLNGKTLQADVLIKVADGEYKTTAITLQHQPFAHRIRIEGNIANPTACKIRFIADVNKQSHGILFSNVRGVTFSGFHLIGETTATNWTSRCLLVGGGAHVSSAESSLIIEGGGEGLRVESNTRFACARLKVSKIATWGVVVTNGAEADLAYLSLVGNGKNTNPVRIPAHINPETPDVYSNGVLCSDNSRLWMIDARISAVLDAVYAARHGYIACDGTSVDQAVTGFMAYQGGILHNWGAGVSKSFPAGRRGKATNCDIGFQSIWNSTMFVYMAVAENCRMGFICTTNSAMHADSGWAKNCTYGYYAHDLSMLSAGSTYAASTGNTTPYSPVSWDPAANRGGYMAYS
ncbi:hypothetical protein HZU77_002085 [Neisseriaceae bacterium TC5R-5]|nr:hypothetical protein [Neisseriaceae bacterium TC5R-5]